MTESIQQFFSAFMSLPGATPAHSEPSDESPFEYAILFQEPVLYVLLRGELEFHHIDRLNEAVDKELAQPSCEQIVVDMGGVSFIDSTGLAFLVNASQIVRERGGQVHLAACTPFVMKALEITRLKRVFVTHEAFPEAYAGANKSDDKT